MTLNYSLIAIAALVFLACASIFEYILRTLRRTVFTNGSASIGRKISNLFRLIFYPIVLILCLQIIGVNLVALLASAGFLGIILGLALQTPLSNAFAGVYISLSRMVKEGDTIRLNAIGSNIFTEGKIKHIGFSHLELLAADGSEKIIPNNLLLISILEKHNIKRDDSNAKTTTTSANST